LAKNKFLNDQEKVEFYADLTGVNLKEYPYQNIMKMYKGAEFLLYHMTMEDLVFDTVIVCTGFSITDSGMAVTLMDRKNFEIYDLGDSPIKVARLDILAHVPPRCLVERTIKVNFKGCKREGMTATAIFRSRSDPERYKPDHQQIIPLTKAQYKFDSKLFAKATAVAEGRV